MLWWVIGVLAAISVIIYYLVPAAEKMIRADAIKKSQLSAIGLD